MRTINNIYTKGWWAPLLLGIVLNLATTGFAVSLGTALIFVGLDDFLRTKMNRWLGLTITLVVVTAYELLVRILAGGPR